MTQWCSGHLCSCFRHNFSVDAHFGERGECVVCMEKYGDLKSNFTEILFRCTHVLISFHCVCMCVCVCVCVFVCDRFTKENGLETKVQTCSAKRSIHTPASLVFLEYDFPTDDMSHVESKASRTSPNLPRRHCSRTLFEC